MGGWFMFEGTILGNLIGILYFALYLAAGIFIANRIFIKERQLIRLWIGIVAGCVLLMWLPALTSFVFGFTILSHIAAAVLLVAAYYITVVKTKKNKIPLITFKWNKDITFIFLLLMPLMVFFTLTLYNHTILPNSAGGFVAGQSTYGDMNLHLSFITSPVADGKFPPHYNIIPPTPLSYPFLGDTISSSIYIFGTSLRLAYMLPMLVSALTVFLGCYIFFLTWLKGKAKATIAWILFFFNGGFGFAYFFDLLRQTPDNISRIFTAFYQTPTNLDDKMVRWVNGVVDMMIPQRATLFGWMMLFACLFLLYRAVYQGNKKYFYFAGVIAGLTPLVNTHIFLCLGIISAVWLLCRMVADNINILDTSKASKYNQYSKKPIEGLSKAAREQINIIYGVLGFLILGAILILFVDGLAKVSVDNKYFAVTIFTFITIIVYGLYQLWLQIKHKQLKQLTSTWGIFLLIVILLAAPQLFGITFKDATSGGFMSPHFNWINSKDNYVWFYIKNIGLPLLLLVPALFSSSKRQLSIVAPAALIVLLADTFSLQPNAYDNNKLLYPAYVLIVGIVAIYMVDIYTLLKKNIKVNKMANKIGINILATIVIFVCMISAVLTMGREIYSGGIFIKINGYTNISDGYELYDKGQVEAAAFIQKTAPGDATILTNDRHNDAISSLSGRDIVCGWNGFISSHGYSKLYDARQIDIKQMYSSPSSSMALFTKYKVDYIMVSSYELNSYSVDQAQIEQLFKLVFNEDGVKLYAVTDRAKTGNK